MNAPSFWDQNERGVCACRSARCERAVGELEEAVHLLRIPLAALLINLGGAYVRSGRYRKARAVLVEDLALDPGDQAGHWLLGETPEALGELLDARAAFEVAAELDPASPEGRSAEDAIARLRARRWSGER
jgi:tetratricopeptide (TPR) repeat protein